MYLNLEQLVTGGASRSVSTPIHATDSSAPVLRVAETCTGTSDNQAILNVSPVWVPTVACPSPPCRTVWPVINLNKLETSRKSSTQPFTSGGELDCPATAATLVYLVRVQGSEHWSFETGLHALFSLSEPITYFLWGQYYTWPLFFDNLELNYVQKFRK